jgi:hypothetical protein
MDELSTIFNENNEEVRFAGCHSLVPQRQPSRSDA